MFKTMPEGFASGQAAMLIIMLAVIGVYDVWIGRMYGYHATVSHQMQTWARAWPILPLVIGLVLGHVFWPTQPIEQ